MKGERKNCDANGARTLKIQVPAKSGDTEKSALARCALAPSTFASIALTELNREAIDVDLPALVAELEQQATAVTKGDLSRGEAMLANQAHTLDAIFNRLTRHATGVTALAVFDTYMRLALRAQNQARTTWETIATMKNPAPVAFVRQANISNGPQQVNNGPHPSDESRMQENENQPSKLLERSNGERLDFGPASTTGSFDSHLETVDPINWTQND